MELEDIRGFGQAPCPHEAYQFLLRSEYVCVNGIKDTWLRTIFWTYTLSCCQNMVRSHVFLMPFMHTYSDLNKMWYDYRRHGAQPKSRISSNSIDRWLKYSYVLLRSQFLRSFAARNPELKRVVLES